MCFGDLPSDIMCPELSDIPGGHVEVSNRTVGSIATYMCDEGYHLEGDMSRTCEDDGDVSGVWSGEEPTCLSK